MILMLIAFNLLVLFVFNYALFGEEQYKLDAVNDIYTDIQTTQESHSTDLGDNQGNWFQNLLGTAANGIDTIVNGAKLILTFGWVFVKGVAQMSIPGMSTAQLQEISVPERFILIGMTGLRAMLWVLIGFEAYLVYINRKTSA